jgi:hypothetical protein
MRKFGNVSLQGTNDRYVFVFVIFLYKLCQKTQFIGVQIVLF